MARDFIPRGGEPALPSNTLAYFFREAVRRIWVSKRTSFVAIGMIAISLYILGAFLLVAENLERAIVRWEGRSRVVVYFDVAATPQQIHAVDAFLAATPALRSRRFVTREEALAEFRNEFRNLSSVVDQLEANPFPPSFEIEAPAPAQRSKAFAAAVTGLGAMPGVEEVQYDWEWLARVRRLVEMINLAGLAAGGILAIAAAFTIANVIRLTMLLYREEIEIMRLVGATERIIRGPFLVEGILQGILGAAFSIALLYGSFLLARSSLGAPRSLLWGFLLAGFLPWPKIAALVAGGMLAGWIGSWISVRGHED